MGVSDFIEAHKCQTVVTVTPEGISHKETWALPLVYAIALDLRVSANNFGSVRNPELETPIGRDEEAPRRAGRGKAALQGRPL